MEITRRDPAALRPHPLNASIYDIERDESDLRPTIAERGILAPLVIDQYGTILSGHRRWRAACALALDTVPVIVRQIDEPLEAERVLIESNQQREKTMSERMHEAKHLKRIYAEEAKARQRGGQGGVLLVANLPQATAKTRDKVAAAVGMKPKTFASVEKVYTTANDPAAPKPVRAVAQRQMAALNNGNAKPHAAEKAVKEAERALKAEAEQQQSDDFMAHINRDGALERARLRTAYFGAKASTQRALLDLDPTLIPDILKEQDLAGAREFATRLSAWATAFEDALPRGLRVLKAE